jgi:hypothetical protein
MVAGPLKTFSFSSQSARTDQNASSFRRLLPKGWETSTTNTERAAAFRLLSLMKNPMQRGFVTGHDFSQDYSLD